MSSVVKSAVRLRRESLMSCVVQPRRESPLLKCIFSLVSTGGAASKQEEGFLHREA